MIRWFGLARSAGPLLVAERRNGGQAQTVHLQGGTVLQIRHLLQIPASMIAID